MPKSSGRLELEIHLATVLVLSCVVFREYFTQQVLSVTGTVQRRRRQLQPIRPRWGTLSRVPGSILSSRTPACTGGNGCNKSYKFVNQGDNEGPQALVR